MQEPKPTVGRSVHFHHQNEDGRGAPLAATVTGVNANGSVDLFVMSRTTSFHVTGVHFSTHPTGGYCMWPPRTSP